MLNLVSDPRNTRTEESQLEVSGVERSLWNTLTHQGSQFPWTKRAPHLLRVSSSLGSPAWWASPGCPFMYLDRSQAQMKTSSVPPIVSNKATDERNRCYPRNLSRCAFDCTQGHFNGDAILFRYAETPRVPDDVTEELHARLGSGFSTTGKKRIESNTFWPQGKIVLGCILGWGGPFCAFSSYSYNLCNWGTCSRAATSYWWGLNHHPSLVLFFNHYAMAGPSEQMLYLQPGALAFPWGLCR